MDLQQYLLKAAMLASRGQVDQAIATVRQGLEALAPPEAATAGPGPAGMPERGEFQMLQRMELQLLLADLLGASGRASESQAAARQAREVLLASRLDPDLTLPLLKLADGILERTLA